MSARSRNMVLIQDNQFKPRPRPVQHASFPAIPTTGCEKSQHSLRCHSRSVEDVRIKTEMLLWGSPHVQKRGKNCLKNYLKVYLNGTRIHILKPVAEHWHLCDLGFALQHGFAVLEVLFPTGGLKCSGVSRSGGFYHHRHPGITRVMARHRALCWRYCFLHGCQKGSEKMESCRVSASLKAVCQLPQGDGKPHGVAQHRALLVQAGRGPQWP